MKRLARERLRDEQIAAELEAGKRRSLALANALKASARDRALGPARAKRTDDRAFFAGPVLRPVSGDDSQ